MTDLSRRILITLLLKSYLDASPGLHKASDDVGYVSRGKKSGAGKAPLHVGESRDLWREGSYAELDKALDHLQKESPRQRHAVFMVFIYQPPRRLRNVIVNELRKSRFIADAEQGMSYLDARMPKYIRVPKVIVENDGHIRRPAATR